LDVCRYKPRTGGAAAAAAWLLLLSSAKDTFLKLAVEARSTLLLLLLLLGPWEVWSVPAAAAAGRVDAGRAAAWRLPVGAYSGLAAAAAGAPNSTPTAG
jgi:hypothetical protein